MSTKASSNQPDGSPWRSNNASSLGSDAIDAAKEEEMDADETLQSPEFEGRLPDGYIQILRLYVWLALRA